MEDISKQGGDGTGSSHHTAWNMPGQRPDGAPFHPPQQQVPPAQPSPAAPIAPASLPVQEVKPAAAVPAQIPVQVTAVPTAAANPAGESIQNPAVSAPAPAVSAAHSDEGIERLIAGVRFRDRCKTYNCVCHAVVPEEGQYVIVDTSEGPEYGQVARAPKIVTDHKHVNFYKVNRIAAPEDGLKFKENVEKEKEAYKICLQKINEKKLEMKLVEADYTFDRSKIIFSFTAEKRVDFRDLVKDLAYALKTRIDMRQIGVRDEAKMLGGYGCCGRELCCVTHLRDFIPVTIKMAKEQNLPLNPAKISGMCGRLMCCLSYEHEMYRQLKEQNRAAKPAEEKPVTEAIPQALADVPEGSDPSGKVTIPVWEDKAPAPSIQSERRPDSPRRQDSRPGQNRGGRPDNRPGSSNPNQGGRPGGQNQGRPNSDNRNRGNNDRNRNNRRPDSRNRPQQGIPANPQAGQPIAPAAPQAPQAAQNIEKKEPGL